MMDWGGRSVGGGSIEVHLGDRVAQGWMVDFSEAM